MAQLESAPVSILGKQFQVFGYRDDVWYQGIKADGRLKEFNLLHLKDLIASDDICIDLGANIGMITLALSILAPAGHVYAFEGSADTTRALQETLRVNALANVSAANVIVGRSCEKVKFFDIPGMRSSGHCVPADTARNAASAQGTSLITQSETKSVDQLVGELALQRLDFIKIDVEGAELDVLSGATQTFQRFSPLVVMEFNSYAFTHLREIAPRQALRQILNVFSEVYYFKGRTGELATLEDSNDAHERFLHNNLFNGFVDDLVCILKSTKPARADAVRKQILAKPKDAPAQTPKIGTPQTASPTLAPLLSQLKEMGFKLIEGKDYSGAQLVFKKILELDSKDINARFVYANLIDDGSHMKHAESRDLMLSILDAHPNIFDNPTEGNLQLIRSAAERCSHVGPDAKAIELFRKLAPASNNAADYFALSEALTKGNFFDESVAALEKAMALDPASYDTEANKEALKITRSSAARPPGDNNGRSKIGRYPQTNDFLGDFQKLIKDHIAPNFADAEKFIRKSTRFFTMGSCFARTLSRHLSESGYASHHLEIAEHINTTFANKVFVDWLTNPNMDESLGRRFAELLPPNWTKERTLAILAESDVFILTLGVAPAFFDKATGDFVLPRPSALNSRALAEKYSYRTTSVKENVDNVLHLIGFIRNVSPAIKIVVTVSPVPLQASFEYRSAVQADCLSKSTLRLVAQEVVYNSGLSDILYWPSFEIFRWAGSNSSKYFAADDGASWHVSEEKVAGTVQAFTQMFSSE